VSSVKPTPERVLQIFWAMNLDIPSPDTDLIETGALDSMAFVELLLRLQEVFGIQVALDDLQIDRFRTARSIATFVAATTDRVPQMARSAS